MADRSGGRRFNMPNERWRAYRPSAPAHGDGSHRHGPPADADARWLGAALTLIIAFMAAEVAAGIAARSLALVSDAAHMLTDAASICLVLVTMKLAARPPKGSYTYGLRRTEILSAQANGITLVLLGAWLGYAAVRRLIAPPGVAGGLVLGTALAGVIVNVAATWLIGRASRKSASRRSLNVEGAFRHILTDVYAFAATALAGLVIMVTGFARADAIASLAVVALMLRAGAGLIRDSGRIFLEAAPAGLTPAEIGVAMAARPHVAEVHDLHIWQITAGLPAASAHVLVAPGQDCHAVRADLEALLSHQHAIAHTTLQVDHVPGPVLTVGESSHCTDPHGPAHRPGAAVRPPSGSAAEAQHTI
jgi:cobalt-zinc-cadmium efflux system protein